MRPTGRHYFYARNWPARLWAGTGLVLGLAGGGAVAFLSIDPAAPLWWTMLRGAFDVAVCVALGWAVALVVGFPVIGPLYFSRYAAHGAPFRPGDWVEVLVGPHQGKVVRVRTAWQHDDVRVDLGTAAAERFEDVFGPLALIRADPPDAPPEAPQ